MDGRWEPLSFHPIEMMMNDEIVVISFYPCHFLLLAWIEEKGNNNNFIIITFMLIPTEK